MNGKDRQLAVLTEVEVKYKLSKLEKLGGSKLENRTR
jgi:hypothetical protein